MESRTPVHYKRRNYFIKKGLQSRFMLGFGLAVLLGLAANLAVAYFLIDRELTQELYRIHIKIRTTSEVAVPIIWKLGAITSLSILIISALVGYFLTRKIEVPLHEFSDAIKDMGRADFTKRLPSDIPTVLPEVYNSAAGSLGAAFGSLRDHAARIDRGFQRAGRGSRAESLSALEDVADAVKSMRRELSRFKV